MKRNKSLLFLLGKTLDQLKVVLPNSYRHIYRLVPQRVFLGNFKRYDIDRAIWQSRREGMKIYDEEEYEYAILDSIRNYAHFIHDEILDLVYVNESNIERMNRMCLWTGQVPCVYDMGVISSSRMAEKFRSYWSSESSKVKESQGYFPFRVLEYDCIYIFLQETFPRVVIPLIHEYLYIYNK